MKYYKDNNNNVYAYDDTQLELAQDKTPMTPEEVQAHINPPKTLEQLKEEKRQEIRTAFETACSENVLVDFISYQGGFDSGIKLDAASRLAERAGATEVTFFDSLNQPHVLSIPDSVRVTMSIAIDYQTKFSKKQSLMNRIETATELEITTIGWN